jgi:RHS repeat-associated protein
LTSPPHCYKILSFGQGFGGAPNNVLSGIEPINGNLSLISSNLISLMERSNEEAGIIASEINYPEGMLNAIEAVLGQGIDISEPDQFFYHTDHLGSSSWITDANGIANQHYQYLPFGEDYVTQTPTGAAVRYTFSAKEKDTETGYSYFGARYYDSDLSVWLSVDPMADKYPNESPYCYAGWNPIMITDPNGMWKDEGDGNYSAEKGDSWWSLHEKSGMSWEETMAYAKNYNAARGQDNWKHVGEGDKVSIPGSGQENSSATSSASASTHSSSTETFATEPIQVQSLSSAPGSAWDPLVNALNSFADKGDIFPLLDLFTSGGPGAVCCPAEFLAVGTTAKGVSLNRLTHIFGKSEHALGSLVKKFGSQEGAYNAVQNAANQSLKAGKLTPNAKGILPSGDLGNIINVAGLNVRLIGGRVENGQVILSSFSRKGL